MDKVRSKIRWYIASGILKTQGIKRLKKEFNMCEQDLMDLWLEERHKMQSINRNGKMNIVSEYTWLKVRVKKKDVDLIKDYRLHFMSFFKP